MSIDICNALKTVVWNETQIPFKPYSYFSPANMQQSLLQAMQGSSIDPDDDKSFNEGYKSRVQNTNKLHDVATTSFICYSAA
jgi:hypothetical protein